MKSLAIAITLSFLFATLFLSFTLAACGTSDTPICSSIFGMNSRACESNPFEHHTTIAKQPTLCTLDAIAQALLLAIAIILAYVSMRPLVLRMVQCARTTDIRFTKLFHVMNPFDPLRFAFIHGRIQQKKRRTRGIARRCSF